MMKSAFFVALSLMMFVSMSEAISPSSSPAPAPQGDDKCMASVTKNMITCMAYVVEGSTEKKPDHKCCDGMKIVMKEEGDKCLCNAFSAAPRYSVKVDVAKAHALPGHCHVNHAHTFSKCLGPSAAPKAAPHHKHHRSAPAPAPSKGSSSITSFSYGLLAVVALLAFSV